VIRVLVADDHAVVRAGLAQLLGTADDIEVVATASNGAEAVALAADTTPEVVLMDLSMPVMDGADAIRRIVATVRGVQVVVLTSFSDQRRILDALDAGASGYVLKDAAPEDLLAAVRTASQGGAPLDPKAARVLLDAQRLGSPSRPLTGREEEVLALVAEGMANKAIARRLGITEHTVKAHLGSVFQ